MHTIVVLGEKAGLQRTCCNAYSMKMCPFKIDIVQVSFICKSSAECSHWYLLSFASTLLPVCKITFKFFSLELTACRAQKLGGILEGVVLIWSQWSVNDTCIPVLVLAAVMLPFLTSLQSVQVFSKRQPNWLLRSFLLLASA